MRSGSPSRFTNQLSPSVEDLLRSVVWSAFLEQTLRQVRVVGQRLPDSAAGNFGCRLGSLVLEPLLHQLVRPPGRFEVAAVARIASQTSSTPSCRTADVAMIGGFHCLGAPGTLDRLSIPRSSVTARWWPSRSALLTTKMSAISRMPALIIWTPS